MADLLLTCSDGNKRWKFLFGSYIPRRWLESVIAKYSKHPHRCNDWLPHIHLKTLDSSALEPCQSTAHASKIIPQVTAIPGFQTEMATKRQNLQTAALRYFTEHITLNLDFQKCIQTLMTDRCKSDKADLIHMFWSYQKLKNYWTLVFKILNEAFNLNITPCVEIAIFGLPEHGIPLTDNMENVASLLARGRILLEWK